MAQSRGTGDAEIRSFDVEIDDAALGSTVNGFEEVAGGDVDIADADVLVSVGRGIDEEENLEIIHDLADALDATVSSSRPIVDNGWLPKTGRSASPERSSRRTSTSRSGFRARSSTSPG